MLEASLGMFYLQNILGPLFRLAASLCFFSSSFMCAGTHTYSLHTLITPCMLLICCSSTLLDENPEFFCPCLEFITQNLHLLVVSIVYDKFSPHLSLPFFSLLSPPCRLISHEYVRGVCCPTAVQTGKWGEGKRSGAGSLRVFSCQSHKPSQYPALELGETKNMGMSLN